MAISNYGNATDLVMADDKKADFEAGAEKIRCTILRHGFSPEAVDMLSFTIAQHTLVITPEQARSGAFHTQADGNPFYAITVSAPGSIMEGGLDGVPTQLAPRKQAQYLAFEIGMNLMMPVKDVLMKFYGETDERCGGGVSSGFTNCKFETTSRCEPSKYMAAMNDLVEFRLNQVAPVIATAPKKRPGGMQP